MISVLVASYRYPQIESWLKLVDVSLIFKIVEQRFDSKADSSIEIERVYMMTRCCLLAVL
jgi:hypothetical protein